MRWSKTTEKQLKLWVLTYQFNLSRIIFVFIRNMFVRRSGQLCLLKMRQASVNPILHQTVASKMAVRCMSDLPKPYINQGGSNANTKYLMVSFAAWYLLIQVLCPHPKLQELSLWKSMAGRDWDCLTIENLAFMEYSYFSNCYVSCFEINSGNSFAVILILPIYYRPHSY